MHPTVPDGESPGSEWGAVSPEDDIVEEKEVAEVTMDDGPVRFTRPNKPTKNRGAPGSYELTMRREVANFRYAPNRKGRWKEGADRLIIGGPTIGG